MDNKDPNNPNQTSTPGTFPAQPAQPAQNPWDAPANPSTPAPGPLTNSNWPSSTDSNTALGASFPQLPVQQNQPDFAPLKPQQDISAAAQNIAPDQQDPLNTAFAPVADQDQTNHFAPPEAPVVPPTEIPPQQPIQPSPDTPDTAAPIVDQPQNPIPDMGQGLPAAPTGEAPNTFDQSTQNPQIPSSNQPGALDLSQLQSNTNPSPEGTTPQSGAPLPEMNPVENAPTDLSHLIAGDEAHQQPGDIYNPPVASDQTPAVDASSPQPAPEDGVSPPGKHLNLTKVLLVAGIPIILIVAALSAYMILGIGKPQSQSGTQTSLPIEKSNQTPLTNPPQQIVAPLPSVVPEPQASSPGLTTAPESTSSGSTLPGASSSPKSAIEQLKARQSSSPSSQL